MQKNIATTTYFFAFDSTTNLPKSGDAANIVCYVTKDAGSVTAVSTNSGVPTEMDATNAKGYYKIALTATETTADTLLFSGKSSTANIVVVGVPATVFTTPPLFASGIRLGTAQGGAGNQIQLDASASATNDFYKGELVSIVAGTGVGQVRTIVTYGGATKQATVDRNWATNPNNTSVFAILAANNPALTTALAVTAAVSKVVIISGTAQAGSTSNTIKLSSAASSTNNIYNNDLIALTGGTGVGQTRTIISYNGSTKFATVDKTWNTTPDNTTTFDVYASTTPSVFSDQGVLQSATASTATLALTASAVNSIYVGSLITILSGTDAGDTAEITGYVGSTRVVTITGTFAVTPDSTSAYAILPTVSGSGVVTSTDVNVISWSSTPVSISTNNYPVVAPNWADVQNPTTTLNLSGTTVKTATDVETDTQDIQSRLPAALVTGRMDSNVQATAASLTFNLTGSITGNLSGSVGSVSDPSGIFTTQMTESYNTDGVAPTLAQALFMIMQRVTEFGKSGATITVNKLDGTTPAYTLTLNNAANPTSSTRAT